MSNTQQYIETNKERMKTWKRDWYLKNKERVITKSKEYYKIHGNKPTKQQNADNNRKYTKINRDKLFEILGGAFCSRCGFKDKRALQLDHVKGGGKKELRDLRGNSNMTSYYIRNPELAKQTLQVLCANCNWIKREENKEYGE